MTILVTFGPTQEPLDAMRLLTNRSTGDLGTRLAGELSRAGHRVIALRGTGCTASPHPLEQNAMDLIPFTTAENLGHELQRISREERVDAIFHAAAVADFHLPGAGSGKIPTSEGDLNLTLSPTPKLLPLLRGWFPESWTTGWKFEASGDRDTALFAAADQIAACRTDACVLNGPSYGGGFGVMEKTGVLHHLTDRAELCSFLVGKLA